MTDLGSALDSYTTAILSGIVPLLVVGVVVLLSVLLVFGVLLVWGWVRS